jgi:membrane associated rhomboid family serine protease
MIPLGDADRRPLHFPIITALIIGANTLVFLLELVGGDAFISRWMLVPEIGDVMGPVRHLVFYLLGRLVSTFAQVVVDPTSTIPSLGASGAIAAVMGAFLITYPRDRIRTILLFGWFAQVTLVPAIILVGLWFLIQVFSEVGALVEVQKGGVAYMAHVGGFIFGMIPAWLFESRQRRMERGLK